LLGKYSGSAVGAGLDGWRIPCAAAHGWMAVREPSAGRRAANADGSRGAHLAVAVLNISGWLQLWLHLTAFAVVARGSSSFTSAGQLAY
jgi:hypothetical protein